MNSHIHIFKDVLKLSQIERTHISRRNEYRIFIQENAKDFWSERLSSDKDSVALRSVTSDEGSGFDIILLSCDVPNGLNRSAYLKFARDYLVGEIEQGVLKKLSDSGTIIIWLPMLRYEGENDVLDDLRDLASEVASRFSTLAFKINITPYASNVFDFKSCVSGFYLCIENCSTVAMLCRVANYLGADPNFSHNSLMYLNKEAGKFETQGTTINVSINGGCCNGGKQRCSKKDYERQLSYYARLFESWTDFLSGSISVLIGALNCDSVAITREDVGEDFIGDVANKLREFESKDSNVNQYCETSSLSAAYQRIPQHANNEVSLADQLRRSCALLMVLLDRVHVRLYGIYVVKVDVGTTSKCELLYMHFDIAPANEQHQCISARSFFDSTKYLRSLYLHHSQDRLMHFLHRSVSAACKSAIGSIMSRNGSHNIGSHVLAALSHNVGTMPDDRVLYQYIQQRMDYIATVTTDFPHWRLSTMLVGNVMKEFMMQRHLLDHIAGSEGLKAYQFQTHSLAPNQKGAIRIHVRRIKDLCKGWDTDAFWEDGVQADNFIVYSDAQNTGNAWMRHLDLSVAIPGGVVGQHAFYTILENVIRNAAKHDWARLSKEDRAVANLDLYVDFKDNPEAGMVECRVWTCITKADVKGGRIVLRAEACKTREAAKCIKDKICTSFIDKFGGLRKENWGIAEMRISAGYLIGSDIADIGGLGGNATQCKALKIIWPVEVGLDKDRVALGYRFNLFKPRELLVVVPDAVKVSDDKINQANSNVNKYGIWLKRESDVACATDLAFSYVLFDRFDVDRDYRLRLPFRVIAKEVVAASNTERIAVARRIIPTYEKPLFDMSDESEVVVLSEGGDKVQERCEKLLAEVYGVWLSHVVNRSGAHADASAIPFVAIDVDGSGKGGERKSLVTKTDLLMFIFEHSFNAAARSFLESERMNAAAEQAYEGDSEAEEDVCNRVFESVLNRIAEMEDRVLDSQIVLAKRAKRSLEQMCTEDFFRMQLAAWYNALSSSNQLTDDETYECFACAPWYSKFVSFVCGPVLSQAESFLAKYEEEFSTLPESFKNDAGPSDDDLPEKPIEIANGVNVVVAFTGGDVRKADYYAKGACCYFRHGAQVSDAIGTYYEALSGSQGYLNSFVSFRERMVRGEISLREKRFLVQLVENAKTRVIIIDERVKDFMSRHDDVNKRLGGLGLAVLGDDDQEVLDLFSECQQETASANAIFDVLVKNIRLGDYDILIIHQGIIDKLLKNHEDKRLVGEFLKKLIRKIRYVVVTTGRGTPANIPDEARVLPYSVVEDTILKCYPEKMVLVDAVMNVLPVRNKKGLES